MSSLTYLNNTPTTLAKINSFADLLMGTMAAQIEVQIKTAGFTPLDKGNLKASARSMKLGQFMYQVIDTAAYAAAQEVGYRHNAGKQRPLGEKIIFVNHPRGGGAHYFQKSVDVVLGRASSYISSAQKAVGLETIE